MSGEKGVMLCERPGPSQMDTSPGPKPFLPSSLPSGMEPLGLVPAAKNYPPSLAPKPPNINHKTIAAVRELEHENRLAALREEERRMAEVAKAEQVTTFGSHLRAAILAGEDISFWRAAKKADAARQSLEASKARSAADPASSGAKAGAAAAGASNKADMTSFVDDLLKEATEVLESPAAAAAAASAVRGDGTADASTSGAAAAAAGTPRGGGSAGRKNGGGKGGAGGKGGSSKPAWALTAEEVSKLDDAEEEELLKFADDLDFDSFMAALDDAELQETVKTMSGGGEGEAGCGPAAGQEKAWRRNLVKVMNHAAMRRVAAARRAGRAGEDDDGLSVVAVSEGGASAVSRATAASKLKSEAAAAKRAALGEGGKDGGGWDGSTRAADDVARMERAKAATQEAFDFLRENPEMRAVHSPASVRAMISKTDGAAS